jgi:hypothetical protein
VIFIVRRYRVFSGEKAPGSGRRIFGMKKYHVTLEKEARVQLLEIVRKKTVAARTPYALSEALIK